VQDIAPLLKLKVKVRLYYKDELKATRLGLKKQVIGNGTPTGEPQSDKPKGNFIVSVHYKFFIP